jgi:hypothetical protein
MALILWPLVGRLPMLGWDWLFGFSQGNFDEYPPWSALVMWPLTVLGYRPGLALLNSILLCTVAVGAARQARSHGRASMLGAAALAVISAPVLMLMWQGNIDAIVLLGVLGLWPGLVYALIKPNISMWALLARRRWLIAAVIWLLISVMIWGWWPPELAATLGPRTTHPIAMGWQNLGWPVALIGVALLPFSRADPWQLMAAGSFLSPYNMPMHYMLLLPAMGRVRGIKRLILWGLAWTCGLVPAFLGWTKFLALLYPLATWWFLHKEVQERGAP